MKNKHNIYAFMLILFTSAIMLNCGGGTKEEVQESEETSGNVEAPATETESSNGEVIKLVINSNDQMQYDKDELRAKAGSTVEITLNHTGQMAKQVMGHNLVILKPGTDVATFASKAIGALDTDYIPEGDEIIVHTELIGGGESTTITFEAPETGTYDFICTFPGHYSLMKGKFIVE